MGRKTALAVENKRLLNTNLIMGWIMEEVFLRKNKLIFLIWLIIFTLPVPVYALQSPAQSAAMSGMVVPAVDLEGLAAPVPPVEERKVVEVSRSAGTDYQKVLKIATNLLGSKYKYGGSGPDVFDCSGFTMYVFGKAGYSLPHTAAEQAGYGVPVDKENLRPGDLVFFSYYNQPGISHVGIYTGDNKFIHASSSDNNGKTVTISALNTQYYEDNYKGARRLLR